jgi:hypothetical protein
MMIEEQEEQLQLTVKVRQHCSARLFQPEENVMA